ncbi:MAG: GNAT family N-acetyltransferase [Halopseudomonas aestusnigri]
MPMTARNTVLPKTERLELRLLHPDDAAEVSKIMTPSVSKWLSSWPEYISEQDARIKIAKYRKNTEDKKALTVAIYRRKDDLIIGSMSVGLKPKNPKVGVIGYWLGEEYQGKGYLGEILNDFVNLAFSYLGITTLEAGAQTENHASFAIMKKMGMKPIGRKSIYVSSRDRDEDVLCYAMTRSGQNT